MQLKQRIAEQFSRAADAYDQVADIQMVIAQHALSSLPNHYQHILDIGCGTGRITQALVAHGAQVTGMDIAPGMIAQAKQQYSRKNLHWLEGDAEAIPLADNSVEGVFSSMALQWCPSLATAFAEIQRVLKPSGTGVLAILGEGSLQQLAKAWDDPNHQHVNAFPSLDSIIKSAELAGLTVQVEQREFVDWFASVKDLLHSIRRIGANVLVNPQQQRFDRHIWQKLQDNYQPYYCADKGYPLSYLVSFISVQKQV